MEEQRAILNALLVRIAERKILAEKTTPPEQTIQLATVLSIYDILRVDLIASFKALESDYSRITEIGKRYSQAFKETTSQEKISSMISAEISTRLQLSLKEWQSLVAFAVEMLK